MMLSWLQLNRDMILAVDILSCVGVNIYNHNLLCIYALSPSTFLQLLVIIFIRVLVDIIMKFHARFSLLNQWLFPGPSNIVLVESEEQLNSTLRKVQGIYMHLMNFVVYRNSIAHILVKSCTRWILACNILLHRCMVWSM